MELKTKQVKAHVLQAAPAPLTSPRNAGRDKGLRDFTEGAPAPPILPAEATYKTSISRKTADIQPL